MKILPDRKRMALYLWLGGGYFLLAFISNLRTYPDQFFPALYNNIWAIIYVTVLNYLLFEFTVPFVLNKRKNIAYNILPGILLIWIYSMFYSYGSYGWRLLGTELTIYRPLAKFSSFGRALESQMAYSAGAIFFFGVSRHIYSYVKLKQATQQLRIEKQEAELNYLKSQTNPHFLFNTLNNIYSLSRDKSDLAPESVLRLSKILRYMLYETGGDYIAIEQELKIINDYIALEGLRYDDTLQVNFNCDVENMKQALPPLLLIPLVENAYKHGVSETRGNPFVDIHLSVKDRKLAFVVKNSCEDFSEQESIKENIGLSNLRRQLELLYTDYDLSVQKTNSVFTAALKINLASHV